jgi:hypothetical protein
MRLQIYTAKTDTEAFRAFLMSIQEYNQKQVRRWVFLYPGMTKDKIRALVRAKRDIAQCAKIISDEIVKESPDMLILKYFSHRRNEICADIERKMLV